MNLKHLKKAYALYETLSDKTEYEALNQLKTHENLDENIYKLVVSLIKNNHQSSQYFDDKIKNQFKHPFEESWKKGDTIGEYELIEPIGQGGMATVFKGLRKSFDSQKPVAIKILRIINQNDELKTKFKAEQTILSKLSHQNIVDYHHGGKSKNNIAYLVMEFIDGGEVINEYVESKNLNKKQIIKLIKQAADAFQYAHNHLIIHRDIKPSNLMVTPNGTLKVLDFGIAKLLTNEQHDKEDKNIEETVMALTPSYASPEQINNQPISTATDIFSLAAVAVALLTGQQPFPENRLLMACKQDQEHVRKLLKSASVDSDLINVLTRALHPEKSRRYENMFAFKSDLTAWIEQKPVSASKDSLLYRLKRFAQRRTALFSTVVVLVLTVASAIIGLSWQNKAIKMEARKADAVKQFMLDSFSVTDPNISQGVDLSTKDLLRLAAGKIKPENDMDPEIKFELFVSLALAHGRLGYYPEAITLLNNALLIQPNDEQATALLAQYLFSAGEIEALKTQLLAINEDNFKIISEQASIKRVRANLLAQAGEYDKAFAMFDQLSALVQTDNDSISNQALLAEMYYLKGESDRSIKIIQQLKSNYPLPLTDVLNLKLNADLVQYYDRVGDFKAAKELTLENIQIYRQILGEEHPDLGMAYNSLSVLQRLEGQLDEAIISAEMSKQIFIKRFGNSSEGLAQAHGNVGVALFYQNHNEQAIEELTLAVDMLKGIFSNDHPETMNALYNLATILNATNQPDKALPILEHMFQVESSTLGKSHMSTLYTQRSLALTLANIGQFENALTHAKESILLLSKQPSVTSHIVNNAYSVLGRIHFMASQFDLAIAATLKSIEENQNGNKNTFARSLNLLAKSYQQLNEHEKAHEYYSKWINQLEIIYGITDEKYLQGLLVWAEYFQNLGDKQKASEQINKVKNILTENDLKIDNIQIKLKQLSLN
ncbi:MAG: protein kinase, partial [Marinicellaceae bacterium]